MMLDYCGIKRTQAEICWLTKPDRGFGTPTVDLEHAASKLGGVPTRFFVGTDNEAVTSIRDLSPFIAFINPRMLRDKGRHPVEHAVVVVGLVDDGWVLFHDPCKSSRGPDCLVTTDLFLAAWAARGRTNDMEPGGSVNVKYYGMVVKNASR
jgi:hypothetical protein